MDASGYLKQRGWRGLGYSLDKNDRGLARPLLTSRKDDTLGIGLKKAAAGAVSDEWWLKALDEGLKDMGKGEQPKAIALTGPKRGRIIYGSREGLYGCFIKGDSLAGSIEEEIKENIMFNDASANTTTVVSATQVVEVSSATDAAGNAATVADTNLSYSSSSTSLSSSSSSTSSSSSSSVPSEPMSTVPTSVSTPIIESIGVPSVHKRQRKQDRDSTLDDAHEHKRSKLKGHGGHSKQKATNHVKASGSEQVREAKKEKEKKMTTTKTESKNAELKAKEKETNEIQKPTLKAEALHGSVIEIKSIATNVTEDNSQDGPQTSHIHADRLALINGTQSNEPMSLKFDSNPRQKRSGQRQMPKKLHRQKGHKHLKQNSANAQPLGQANGIFRGGDKKAVSKNELTSSTLIKNTVGHPEKLSRRALKRKGDRTPLSKGAPDGVAEHTQRSTKKPTTPTANNIANFESKTGSNEMINTKGKRKKHKSESITKSVEPASSTLGFIRGTEKGFNDTSKDDIRKNPSVLLQNVERRATGYKRGHEQISMSEKKMKTYTIRAESKGISLAEYMDRRSVKKKKLARKT